MCKNYDVVHATTCDIRYTTLVCRDCVSRNCGRKTCQDCEEPYTCYRAVVLLNYGDQTEHCEYNDRQKKFRSEQARDAYYKKKFPLGSEHNFLVKTKEEIAEFPECTKIEKGMGIWIAGMVFICFAGITFITWIVYSVMTYEDWKANTVYTPPPATRLPNIVRYQRWYNLPRILSPRPPANAHVELVHAMSNTNYIGASSSADIETESSNTAPSTTGVALAPSAYNPLHSPSCTYAYPVLTPDIADIAAPPNNRSVSYNTTGGNRSAYEDYDVY